VVVVQLEQEGIGGGAGGLGVTGKRISKPSGGGHPAVEIRY